MIEMVFSEKKSLSSADVLVTLNHEIIITSSCSFSPLWIIQRGEIEGFSTWAPQTQVVVLVEAETSQKDI